MEGPLLDEIAGGFAYHPDDARRHRRAHEIDMAKAYADHAGKPLKLSDGVENAGYEFPPSPDSKRHRHFG